MPRQTRLNFSKQPTTASKRRKRDSDDETNEQNENERPTQRPKTTASSSTSSNQTKNQTSPTENSGNTKSKTSPDVKLTSSKAVTQSNTPHITLTYHKSSLFLSPPQTLLCHATNAQGSWGAGIALAFKKSYPSAFKIYASHCSKWSGTSLLGTTLLIPPQNKSPSKAEREAQHWVACLFTSEKKGKGKGSRESVLEATGEAIEDLVRKVRGVNETADEKVKAKSGSGEEDRIAEVRVCKINSGLFGVPWEATSEVIEGVEIGEGDIEEIAVYSLD
jgi:ADP-ribose 1''-phosphate phosphatase